MGNFNLNHLYYIFVFLLKTVPLAITFNACLKTDNTTYSNPIISGSYPDPSICKVGEDFYLVNSSFEYFPGLPIHHSKDLVNWELVGYGLHREAQCSGKMNLINVQSNGGIHAPSIRYHDGFFYIITTNVYSPAVGEPAQMINFIITSKNIEGPWSDPKIIDGAPGIDPDIIFDDNKVWYVGTHSPDNPKFNGEGEIWLQELNPTNWSLIGKRHFLWRGALYFGTWAEGPHIYKRNGYYYLLIAEGGTSLNHGVMVAVSSKITGPYVPNDRNPILTSRHLSNDYWVNSVGHGDLIELANDRWYMVILGIRSEIKTFSNMGRETHLAPVIWEKESFDWQYDSIDTEWSQLSKKDHFEKLRRVNYEWPVCSPITGRLEKYYPLPFSNSTQNIKKRFLDDFGNTKLDLEWNFRRVPNLNTYEMKTEKGFLRLFASPNIIEERSRCSILGIRQKESQFSFTAKMLFNPKSDQVQSGISLFQKDDNYITYTIEKTKQNYILKLVVKEKNSLPITIKKDFLPSYEGSIIFKITSDNKVYKYFFSIDDSKTFHFFAENDADVILCKSYTGTYCGLYATSNGKHVTEYADYDWVILE